MPCKPRGERGWWLERRPPGQAWPDLERAKVFGFVGWHYVRSFAGALMGDWAHHREIALWRLASLQRRRLERMREYLEECRPCIVGSGGCVFYRSDDGRGKWYCHAKHGQDGCDAYREWKEAMA